MENAGYKASKEKSKFLKPEAEWLGYKIEKEGIKPLRDKTKAIGKLKPPKNVKDIRSFLGSVQYLAKHIPNSSEKTAPIRELVKKDSTWNGGEKREKAFNEIKTHLEDPQNLAHFNPSHESIITCDASTLGLGAALQQIDSGGNRKIDFKTRQSKITPIMN